LAVTKLIVVSPTVWARLATELGVLAALAAAFGMEAAAMRPTPLARNARRDGTPWPEWPVLSNPANRDRAVPLTYEQFRYAFANAVPESEAEQLYEEFSVPGAGKPLFQAAVANLNPWTEDKVENNPNRGPLLIVCGEHDHTVPPVIARASFAIEKRNPGVTEIVEIPGRGHALTIDHGWRDVAETALAFAQRFVSASGMKQ
jgi:pimeloyl-ACP methyl ester carboxylesterase